MVKSKRTIVALCIFSFGIQAYWMVENFWINLYWTRNVDPRVTYIGLMVALSAIVGVLTQIIFGALSDSTKSKYGRRRPYILIGSITGGIAMCFFPITRLFSVLLLAILYAIILDALITFFGDITTPTNMALLAETTEVEERGKINALVGFCGGIGIVIVVLISGYIFEIGGPDLAFYFGGISLMICGTLCFLISKDPPVSETRPWTENLKETFTIESYRENKSLYILLLFLFVNTVGVQLTAPFLFIYVESVLGLSGWDLALVLGGFAFMGFLLSIPIGVLLDKFGRKKIMYIVTILGSFTAFMFAFIPGKTESTLLLTLIFGGLMVGFSAGVAGTAATWMQDLAPEDRKSSLLAYRIVAMVIPMIPGALIGGLLADYGPKPEGYIYSPIIFILSGIVMLSSLPILKYIEETLKKEKKK
ncbi:MAG: MFS transporter [Promethearchaeota archaeon]